MREIHDLVARIGKKARAQRPLPAAVDLEQIRSAEANLGFPLPPLLKALYLHVADGGFGPGGDVPLPGYNAALLYPLDKAVEAYQDNRTTGPFEHNASWPVGVLPLLSWGCFAEAAIDCLDPASPVLMYESDLQEVAPGQAWRLQATSLAIWWEAWLSGELPTATQIWRR